MIEALRKVPANSLTEADYLLAAGGDRVGALDVRATLDAPDSPSASDLHSLPYLLQAAEAVEQAIVALGAELLEFVAEVGEEAVEEGGAIVAQAGLGDDACGLINDEEVLVAIALGVCDLGVGLDGEVGH